MYQEALDEALNAFMFKHKEVYFETEAASPEAIDNLEHMEIRDSDVFILTYPKSGTIWTQQILSLISNEGHRNGTENILNITRAPWIEYNIYNVDFKSRPSPRLFSSHLPYYLMPKDLRYKKGKIIYVYRNPKDVLVSFYHYYKSLTRLQCNIDWKIFFDLFLSGRVIAGSWFDHIRGWYTHNQDYNILFLSYEEMTKDLRSAVLKICKFVDKELDDQAIDIVVEKASFNSMKHDPLANYEFSPKEFVDIEKSKHVRKGAVGDWKNIMTVAQNEEFDRVYRQKMGDLPLRIIWSISNEDQS